MVRFTQLCTAVALSLSLLGCAAAQSGDGKPGTYKIVQGNSMASAMMLGLANENTAFIMDKVEGNPNKTNSGKPVWSSLVNLDDWSVKALDAQTNPFCASGAVLGNGSYIVAGGNKAVGFGGASPGGDTGPYGPYNDQDGRRVVRILEPNDNMDKLVWNDEYNSPNQMDSERWYPGIEVMADGSVVLIGGATSGGYINRNYPNKDPAYATDGSKPPVDGQWAQGGANPSYEFWPQTSDKPKPQVSQFMIKTSGLNMYAHTYLMPSGQIFMQANYSTVMWDAINNKETALPDMPGQVVRVYPASGATAMLPLTPSNQYTPTILFCGGLFMEDEKWGDYTKPNTNMYKQMASADCSSITPETADGKAVNNVQYDHVGDLPEGRSMGQFIHLPDGKLVIVNGAQYGTAGYGNTTWNQVKDTNGNSVNLEGFSQDPTYRPVLFDPEAPKGKQIITDGLGNSTIARLYHSSAILIPDGSVLVAGSNPHQDYTILPKNIDSKYKGYDTTYALEQWYPPYYFEQRPPVNGVPKVIGYGGPSFNVTVPASFMGKAANDMANSTKIMVIRPGFSTHAMNMGQRSLQLDNSYEVLDNGDVNFIVNPMPTNQNIFVAGPALFFVTVNGVPSKGKQVLIGKENLGNVPYKLKSGDEPAPLPEKKNNPKFNAKLNQSPSSLGKSAENNSLSGGAIAGIVVGIIAAVILFLLALLLFLRYRRRNGTDSKYAALGNTNGNVPPSQGPRAQTTPHAGAVGAMPWAGAANEGVRRDQPYDESRVRMMAGNESQAELHDPNQSTEPFGPKGQFNSYSTLPHSNSRYDGDYSVSADHTAARYSDQVPMSNMAASTHYPSGQSQSHYSGNSPLHTGTELHSVQSHQMQPSVTTHGGYTSAMGSPVRTPQNGPVLLPDQHSDQGVAGYPAQQQYQSPQSHSQASHLAGPREMPVRSNLQQHLHMTGQDAGQIRRIQ